MTNKNFQDDRARKRVLLMVSSMRGGGSERQVLMLARSLDRNRFCPHLYLTEAKGSFLKEVPDDVPIHSFDSVTDSTTLYIPGRQLRRQTAFVRSVIEEHRIDVVYDRTFHMTLLAGKASSGVRRVSTIVSPPHLALPLVEKRFVALKRRRLAAAYRTADAVVAVSEQAARSAESYYGLAAGSVTVIRNPIDIAGVAAAVDRTSRGQRDRTRLVCVGRMTREKGHRDLISAIGHAVKRWPERVPPLSVRLIGDGPERASLMKQIDSLDLSSIIQCCGASESALQEIADADALVLPSRFEGMPNVVLEAMALETPVIATRAGGTVELQADEPTAFWAQPGDPDSIADAILAFAASPETAESHTRAATALLRADHDLKQVVGRIEDLLDPVAGSIKTECR